ncbi:hypothetical protein FQU23_015275 [Flavobacterium sp. XN-5]|uniref:hypothetical protein n=1 Tax=Flavobacterium sp. XN-5 TaxID=2599390 RepID=UPI0011CAB2E8|nr:hypothetical protein [Flavobacterium sp. XN-5]NGY38864.1 hypothetical protein [Flavobacterium sp. XN-5]
MKQDKTKVDNFEQIDIDNRDKIWTNNELNNILQSYTKPRTNDAGLELEPLTRLVNFCEYTSYITDEKLLNEAINYIKKESYLIDTDKKFEALKNRFNKVYSDSDWKIIKAIFYSLEARFQIFIANINPSNYNQPFFYFEIKDRVIYHNLNFVKEITLRNSDIDFKENIKALPIETRKEIYDKRIESLIDLDYKHGTNISSKTIKYLKKSKKSLDTIIKPTIQVSQKISEIEKDEVFNEMVFDKGLFYYSDIHKVKIQNAYKNLENDFETKEDFVKAVNSLLHANGLHFYSKLRTITNESEFIKYIQSQYDLYNEYTPNNSLNWLDFTKKAIMYGFGILRIENEHLKALFMNWYNDILKTVIPEQPQQDNEIDIYLKSYNESHFDEVMIKRNEDGTPNNIYLGNNFNEWLTNIDRNLLANKSYDAETQDKLSAYNKYLLFLAQDLIGLYKAVSGYEKTNNLSFITSIHIQENKVLQSLKSIKFYDEIVKHYSRNKQFQKANDIKDYCISLFDNCVYNLNDVLTIDIYKSPLKTHFEDVKTDLKNSINFKDLKILKDLSEIKFEIPTQDYKKSSLVNNGNITLKGIYQPIVFTLKEYESIYESRLLEHLKIHIDYDVNHFILEDISHYKFYISLIEFIGCVPDDMMNEKHKFAIINIADFDYNNLYFKEGAIDSFFHQSEENDKGYVIIEEARPDVMNVINLFKNLTFDEFIFKGHNLKNSFRLIIKFLKKKRKELNVNKIKTQTDLNVQIEQPETNEPDESLLNNQDIKIFKSDIGFTLFTKMFELYKTERTHLANFSFLFFAMEKDFLVCSQAEFVRFLESEIYDISIGKIDNRHLEWQKNKKAKLYNSIKEPLQKKHEKSTI